MKEDSDIGGVEVRVRVRVRLEVVAGWTHVNNWYCQQWLLLLSIDWEFSTIYRSRFAASTVASSLNPRSDSLSLIWIADTRIPNITPTPTEFAVWAALLKVGNHSMSGDGWE